MLKFLGGATFVVFGVFGNDIEVLGDNFVLGDIFVLLNAKLEPVLCGDCQNMGERCHSGSHTRCSVVINLFACNFARISRTEPGSEGLASWK